MSVWWLHAILWSVLALNLLCSAQLQEPEDSDEQVTAQDESSESYTDGPDQSYSYDRVADQRDDLDDYDVKYRGEGDFETNFPDNQRAVASYSVTTDIFCWMGNSRISQTCSLERCDYWLTYNATKSFRGFACIRIGYSIDRIPHVYRNCVHTVSTKYDPCEQAIIEANSPRINVTSCEVCWDNGCNIHGLTPAMTRLARRLLGQARQDKPWPESAVKSFDQIPGPTSLPLVGTLHKYLPIVGEYQFDRLHRNGLKKYHQFGPLVREQIVPGVQLVWVFTPEDIGTVFRTEGRYPERRSHLALEKYRLDRPHVYSSGGLLPTNGPEWWRIRSELQKGLSEIRHVRQHLPDVNQIMDEFIELRIGRRKMFRDFLPELSRLYLEIVCQVAFGERLYSFSPGEDSRDSLSSTLIAAALAVNSCVLKTDNGPQLWRKFDTPLYRKLKNAHALLEEQAIKFVRRQSDAMSCPHFNPAASHALVHKYLASEKLSRKDTIGMSVDFLLAGIDTSSYTSSFLLYHLANNPTVQEKLYDQVKHIHGDVQSQDLDQAGYAKATLKETLRLNPVSVGVGRTLGRDAVLSGYRVPAGTFCVTQNQVTCRLPEYFPRPGVFVPERWLRQEPEYAAVSPYLLLPFGHGPRTCIARRSSEQNLQLLAMKLAQRYYIKWHGGSLDCRSLLINKPDQPVALEFISRK